MVFEKVVTKYYVWSLNHSYLPYVFDNECTVDMGKKVNVQNLCFYHK